MRILVLKDAKPGHFRQSEAIAAVLAGLMPAGTATVERMTVKPRWFAHDRVRQLAARSAVAPAWVLRLLYGAAMPALAKGDLIVSSGRPTVLAGLLIARATGARFVYRGAAIGYDPDGFALILVAEPSQADGGAKVFAPLPAPVEASALPAPRPLRSAADFHGATAALLIGGDSHSHHFAETDWQGLANLVRSTTATLGLSWQVTTSRRTPDRIADRWAALGGALPAMTFIDYRRAGAGSIDRILAADVIAVTSDSTSMIADAAGAMRPVVAIDPARAGRTAADRAIEVLVATGQLVRMSAVGLDADRFVAAVIARTTPTEDPRLVLRRILADRLGLVSASAAGSGP